MMAKRFLVILGASLGSWVSQLTSWSPSSRCLTAQTSWKATPFHVARRTPRTTEQSQGGYEPCGTAAAFDGIYPITTKKKGAVRAFGRG